MRKPACSNEDHNSQKKKKLRNNRNNPYWDDEKHSNITRIEFWKWVQSQRVNENLRYPEREWPMSRNRRSTRLCLTLSGWRGLDVMDAEVGEATLNGGEEQGVTAWGRWAPCSWEYLVCTSQRLPSPTASSCTQTCCLGQTHPWKNSEWRSSLSLSFWPGHRSTCVYQLRTNSELSTVRKSCCCWPNSPLSCEVEPLD